MKKFRKIKPKNNKPAIDTELEKPKKFNKNLNKHRSYYDDLDGEKWSKKKYLDEYYEEE